MRIASFTSTAVVTIAAVAVLAGCSTPSTTAGSGGEIDAAALLGTWVLEEEFPTAPETPYLSFTDDDAWVGSDGCNTTAGTWDLAADGTIAVTAGPSTMIACDGAPLPMLFSETTSVAIDGDALTITGADGATTLVRSTDANVGPQDPVGFWGTDEAGQPSLELGLDGALAGTDGCNQLVGSWALADGQLKFLDVATTLMACEGVDTWLSGASFAFLQGGTMTIYAEDGTQLGQLERAE